MDAVTCEREGCLVAFQPSTPNQRFCSRRCRASQGRNWRPATRDPHVDRYTPIPTSLEYERWVEQPRRRGIDPVWQSLLTQALADNPQPIHKGVA